MLNADVTLNKIMHLLQNEVMTIQRLVQALEKECALLANQDAIDALETVVSEKAVIIKEMEEIGMQRENLISTLSYNPLTEDKQMSVLWNELLSLADDCKKQNRINGCIIETGVRQSRKALDIIQGREASQPDLYNQAGHTSNQTRSRTITQA